MVTVIVYRARVGMLAALALSTLVGCRPSPNAAPQQTHKSVIYDVNDIARNPRGIRPMKLGMLFGPTAVTEDYVSSLAVTGEELLCKILELAPADSWSEGSILLTKRELAVKHTPEVHKKLRKLLTGILTMKTLQLHFKGYRVSGIDLDRELASMGKKLDGQEIVRLSANEAQRLLDRVANAKGCSKLPEIIMLNGEPSVVALTDKIKTYTVGYDQKGQAVTPRYRTGFVLETVPVIRGDGAVISLRLRVAYCKLLRTEKKQTKHGMTVTPILAEEDVSIVTWVRSGQSLVIRMTTPGPKKPKGPASWVIITPEVLKHEPPEVRILSQ